MSHSSFFNLNPLEKKPKVTEQQGAGELWLRASELSSWEDVKKHEAASILLRARIAHRVLANCLPHIVFRIGSTLSELLKFGSGLYYLISVDL